MRVAKRICAFALALTIAFLSVGYEPPKANAVVAESAIIAEASAVAAAYMSATGLTLGASSAAAASAGTASLISGYAAATGGTVEVITTSIAAGATIGTGGVIILSVAAVALLAGITAWVIDEYGLIGEDGEPVAEPVPVFQEVPYLEFEDGSIIRLGTPELAGDMVTPNKDDPLGPFYFSTTYSWGDVGVQMRYLADDAISISSSQAHSSFSASYYGLALPWTVSSDAVYYGFISYNSDGTYKNRISCGYDRWEAILDVWGAIQYNSDGSLAASVSPDYAPKPELAPDTQVVLNPNLAPEFYPDAEPAPEALSEAIFEKLANGDFTPQYTEEPVTDPDPDPDTGGGDNPDDGTEEEPSTGVDLSGVLGWLEAIWNAIKSLVEAIGDKLMQLFVPSEGYMEALPEALTDAFAERTGFLTYPMSLLFGFVDLIATPAGDFILEWDDVYEPFSHGKLISAGQFNVTQYVNSNQAFSNVYSLWKTVVSGYLIFMFFDLCYKKYNAIVRDRLG